MLARHNPVDIENALRSASPPPPFPPAADRQAWRDIARSAGDAAVAALIARAEEDATTPIPALPATLWLEFQRNGQREGYQEPRSKRRALLASLVLAECLENKDASLIRS